MKYYILVKTKNKDKINDIVLTGGYSFKSKINITLYNRDLINNILLTKINKKLSLLFDEDDEDGREIEAEVQTLRKSLLNKYAEYIEEKEVKKYLKIIDNLSKNVNLKRNRVK